MSFYVYLISSLPMLHFGARLPFSREKFFSLCKNLIPDSDLEILKKCSITGDFVYEDAHPALKKWQGFDTSLRNELAKIRAAHKHLDADKYLRQGQEPQAHLAHLALSAQRNPNILEAEKLLDQERWRALDEISFGHYFDLDFLILYTLKLLILERWERVNTADRLGVLEEALEKMS